MRHSFRTNCSLMVWLAPTRLRPLHYQALVSRYQALVIRYQALVVRRSQPRHQSETKPQNRKIGHWHTNSARMCSKNAAPPISAAWDLQSHTIEYQDFQSEKKYTFNMPLACVFGKSLRACGFGNPHSNCAGLQNRRSVSEVSPERSVAVPRMPKWNLSMS